MWKLVTTGSAACVSVRGKELHLCDCPRHLKLISSRRLVSPKVPYHVQHLTQQKIIRCNLDSSKTKPTYSSELRIAGPKTTIAGSISHHLSQVCRDSGEASSVPDWKPYSVCDNLPTSCCDRTRSWSEKVGIVVAIPSLSVCLDATVCSPR